MKEMGELVNNLTIYDGMKKMYNIDDPYCNCYFMSLLYITKTFGKNDLEIILNADLTYNIYEKNDSGYPGFRLKVDTIEDIHEVLERMGIGLYSNKIESKSVIDSIKDSLNQGHLALMTIDLYYQKDKVYYYQKQHGEHSVLVFGYSDENQCLYIIDNINKGYQKYAVSYEDVSNYIEGLCKYCGYDKSAHYFTQYYVKDSKSKRSDIDVEENFFINIRNRKLIHETALESILEFHSRLKEMCSYPSFEENLLTMKYRKASLCYRNRLILDKYFLNSDKYNALIMIQDDILKIWAQIRTNYLYMKIRKTSINDISINLSEMLVDIYQKETVFHKIFFELIESLKKRDVKYDQ